MEMRPLGWALGQYAWCPYTKGIKNRDRYAQREGDVKTHREKIPACLEKHSDKSRNTEDCWKTPEIRRDKEGSSLTAVRGSVTLPAP